MSSLKLSTVQMADACVISVEAYTTLIPKLAFTKLLIQEWNKINALHILAIWEHNSNNMTKKENMPKSNSNIRFSLTPFELIWLNTGQNLQ